MTDADRIVKARKDMERARQIKEDEAKAVAERARYGTLRTIESLVPQVLAALAGHSYPDAALIRIEKRFGSTERAAWHVANAKYWLIDGYQNGIVYLLSTGEFIVHRPGERNKPRSASEIGSEIGVSLGQIEAGLRSLLRRYGDEGDTRR